MSPLLSTLSLLGLLASRVSAHGHVSSIIADGVEYPGADPSNPSDDSPGWQAANQDNGFVAPSSFSSPDIVCHKTAVSPPSYATVAAGGTVTLQWSTWPDSHHGPVLDYLASCDGDCTAADPASLFFAKIDEGGLIEGENPGYWASDDLVAAGNAWTVTIPEDLAPGNYVLRHEIIGLHSAGQEDGAQAYPQCVNLEVTGGGPAVPSGVPATEFYSADDPGILINIYGPIEYVIPGPALWQG